MSSELTQRIIARLSNDERSVMELRSVQLATAEGDKGIVVEKHMKVPTSTFKSLNARGLIKGRPDPRSRVMPLTSLGISVNEALVVQHA